MKNIDPKTVEAFGREWSSFDQTGLSDEDKSKIFDDYFHVFPWGKLPSNAVGMDVGCGSGRWAQAVAPWVGHLHLVDASNDALQVAKKNLSISIAIKKKYKRKGFGKQMLVKTLKKKKISKFNIIAIIKKQNLVSKKFFLDSGFKFFKKNIYMVKAKR